MSKFLDALKNKQYWTAITKNNLTWVALAFAFFESPFLNRSVFFEIIYIGILLLGVAFVLVPIWPIRSWRSLKISSISKWILGYEALLVFSTIIKGVMTLGILLSVLKFVVLILVLDTMFRTNFRKTIKMLYGVIEALVWINSLTILFFPNGIYNIDPTADKHYYFLGHQNAAGIFLLFAIMLGAVYVRLGTKWPIACTVRGIDLPFINLRLGAMWLIGTVAVLKVWSALSFVGILILLALLVYDSHSKKGWRFDPAWAILINVIVFMVFVVFQRMDLLAWLIEDILHRSLTLSGRTKIWNLALQAVFENPFFGVGLEQGKAVLGFTNAHNRYLNVLFTGGLAALTVFSGMLWKTRQCICQHRKDRVMRVCSLFMWTLLFLLEVETFDGKYFFLLFLVPFHWAQYLDTRWRLHTQPRDSSNR